MGFVRLTMALIGCLTLLIGAAALVPRLGGPYRIAWLDDHNTCELPCWRGITPGATLFDEGANLIYRMVDVTIGHFDPDSSVAFQSKSYPHDMWGYFYSQSGKSVLFLADSHITLADVVAKFGKPDQMFFYVHSYLLTVNLAYLKLNMIVSTSGSFSLFPRHDWPRCTLSHLNRPAVLFIGEPGINYGYPLFNAPLPGVGFSSLLPLLCAS